MRGYVSSFCACGLLAPQGCDFFLSVSSVETFSAVSTANLVSVVQTTTGLGASIPTPTPLPPHICVAHTPHPRHTPHQVWARCTARRPTAASRAAASARRRSAQPRRLRRAHRCTRESCATRHERAMCTRSDGCSRYGLECGRAWDLPRGVDGHEGNMYEVGRLLNVWIGVCEGVGSAWRLDEGDGCVYGVGRLLKMWIGVRDSHLTARARPCKP
eukprot:300094-Chlamydomonas_euryale.AAC.1